VGRLPGGSPSAKMRFAAVVAGLSVAAGAAALAGFGGFLIGKYRLPPFETVEAVEWTVFGSFWKTAGDRAALDGAAIPTAFVRLHAEMAPIPVDRPGAGGGLTALGDAVLLLTHEGRIFAAHGPDDVVKTAIAVPDNGLDAYRAAARSDRLRDLAHRFETFRYNDLLAVDGPDGPALALSYTHFDGARACYANRVALLPLGDGPADPRGLSAVAEDWTVVHTTRPCLPLKATHRALEGHIAGGRMAFRPPATLYLGSGDYHFDGMHAPEIAAQDPAMEYGKVLAIDLGSGAVRTISSGHRNIQGIAVDRRDRLWVAEHGMRGGDELNRIVDGANYGWPLESIGTLYNRAPIPGAAIFGRHERHRAPVHAWVPSVAASSLIEVEGFHPAWDGDLLMASLKARSLYRIRERDGRALFVEPIRIGERVRDVGQLSDGRLVLLTDSRSLYFVSASDIWTGRDFVEGFFTDTDDDPALRRRVLEVAAACGACHAFEPGEHGAAPSLAGLYGARVASAPFNGYSPALRRLGGRWTRPALTAYLDDPGSVAPGTTMPDPGLDDPAVIDRLIDVLAAMAEPDG